MTWIVEDSKKTYVDGVEGKDKRISDIISHWKWGGAEEGQGYMSKYFDFWFRYMKDILEDFEEE